METKPKELPSTWDFITKYYPNYDHADEIAWNDDLRKLLDNEQEVGDCAYRTLMRDYNGDIENPQIEIDYNAQMVAIYEAAIENYIKIKGEL